MDIPATVKTFEARIWEKSEHRYFDVTVIAENEKEALRRLHRDYPPFRYAVNRIREDAATGEIDLMDLAEGGDGKVYPV